MEKLYSATFEKLSLFVLPIEMIGTILSYLTTDKSFFWNYGVVCRSFLNEVAKIMKQKNMKLKLNADNLFKEQVEWICQNESIALVVEEIGLDLSNNNLINQTCLRRICTTYNQIKILDLSFCDLQKEDILCLCSLSNLRELNFSGCSALNDYNLTLILKQCIQLSNLSLLMCENISDKGKLKHFPLIN